MAFDLITPTRFSQSAISTTLGTLYTVPTGKKAIVKDVNIVNTTGAAIVVTIHAGLGVASLTNTIINVSVAPNSVYRWIGVHLLDAGDTVQTIASATGCSISISGGEAV